MFCEFKHIQNKWICSKCGRITPYKNEQYMPTAKCRLPEFYYLKSKFVNNYETKGVGDCLLNIFKKMNHNVPVLSRARAKITCLNNKGIEWCSRNQLTILEWIKEECSLYNIPFSKKLFMSIIRLSIYKAKNQKIPI